MAKHNGILPANKTDRENVMKGIAAAFAGLFVMACSGCGGGGGGSPSTVAAAQPKSIQTVAIDAEGDSTMWGLEKDASGAAFQTKNSAPVVLQSILQGQFSAKIVVNNNGVPSASVADSLNGTAPYYSQPIEKRLAASASQIVLENDGINDAQRVTTDQFYSNLTLWVQRVKMAGKTPVLEEPNPITRAGSPDLAPYVAIINQVASVQNVPVVKQFDYIQSLPNWQTMLTDGIHPNDALYAIKAQREAHVLNPIIQNLVVEP